MSQSRHKCTIGLNWWQALWNFNLTFPIYKVQNHNLLPMSKKAWSGLFLFENLVRIYVMVSEYDAAIDQIEYLLSIPRELSIPLLKFDPAWDLYLPP